MASTTTTKTESSQPVQKYEKVILTLENVLLSADKLNNSPSAADGLDPDIEYDIRVLGCEMIQTSGILLRLPQVAMAGGQVLFQRLYYTKSLVRYPMEATAMACVALASKIEEAPRKIRDVINVFRHIRQVRNGKTLTPVILDSNYVTLKNQVIKAERRLLKELGFCCHVKHPHKVIMMYLRLVEADDNRALAKMSWNYMNDALRTDVFMRYTPESVACACIWLAARQQQYPLPENPPWYHVVNVDIEEIHLISAAILKLYTRPKVKLETLEAKIEEIRKQQQDAKLRNKALPLHQQTPLQPTNSTFSPGSRNHSPRNNNGTSGLAKDKSSKQTRRKDAHHRSGTDTSNSSESRRSRSGASPNRNSKKMRRSDSRDRSRSRSRSNDRRRSRERSRGRSRDRHNNRKSVSKSRSPNITPPPMFSKNKDKGPMVHSASRSRSRSPLRTYDKYDKHSKYERRDKHSSSDKNNKYSSSDKYDTYDKNTKLDDRYAEKVDKQDKYNSYDKNSTKYVDKYDKNDSYKEDKHKDEKLSSISKYEYSSKDKADKYEKSSKYKVEKYDKSSKYEKSEKKRSHESKKYDNGYEKVHKSKKASRHRSRSRDRRR